MSTSKECPDAPVRLLVIGRYLTISTAHIRPSTADLLDAWAQLPPDERLFGIADTGVGWFVRIPESGPVLTCDVPAELLAALAFAHELGCQYLRLDRDSDEIDSLELFDW